MSKLKVLELFSGIGACSKALERLGIDHEIVDSVEIDKYAVKSFNAVHGTNFEPQDITKWDKDIDVDLIMHGSPCQDFSVAGKGAGGDKDSGTRSSLMYETLRIVEKLKPKYVIWENVKNLLSKKHIHNFEAYQEAMRNLGYVNYYKVLNAKDYGIPQNRERVFTVSIRNDICDNTFEFPEPFPLEKKLKDILDTDVDEKYYLTKTDNLVVGSTRVQWDNSGKGYGSQQDRAYYQDGIGPSLSCSNNSGDKAQVLLADKEEAFCVAQRGRGESGNTKQHLEARKDSCTNTITSVAKDNYVAEPIGGGIAVKTANKKGYDMAKDGDSVDLAYPNSTTRRGRVGHEVSKTLECGDTMAVVVDSSVKPSVAKNFEREKEQIATTDKEIYQCKCETAWQDNKVGCKVSPSLRSGNACTYGLTSNYRIRKLTPKECWRLMGFDDSDFEKAEKVNSNSQLYKQAGNSIVVNVLEGILKNLLENEYGR